MKLRYEGSIDDATDFWLFYLNRRAHPCGWSVNPQNRYIYKPPDGKWVMCEGIIEWCIFHIMTLDSYVTRKCNESLLVYLFDNVFMS